MTLPPRISIEIGPERHRLLREIQAFLYAIHHQIHPDMFDIDPGHVTWLGQLVEPDVEWLTVTLSRDELFAMETMVMAAWEYSLRTSTGSTLDAADEDVQALEQWISEQCKRFTTTLH